MAKSIFNKKRWQGFSDYQKDEVEPDKYFYAQAIDYRTDPQSITLLPTSLLESGTVVVDLLKWADIVPTDLSVYAYGSNGTFYKRTIAGSWSALRTVANSHGNGLSYFAGDDYVYYPSDSTIGRYGPMSGTPQFSDDFLASQGGVRLNTYSATFVAASSQYATAADSASLSVTGNLTLECYINPTSLPAIGSQMILMSKWRSGNNTRSYKFDIAGIAASFGDGSDGNYTVSVDTTEAPIDSACTGTQGTNTLSATNGSFASGQQILIHQSYGTNAGTWMRTSIVGYTAGTITTADSLNINYITGAQVRVLKQYADVTVNSGKTWTCKAWNGTVGGVFVFLCSGTLTVTGTISANGGNGSYNLNGVAAGGTGGGFRGGAGRSNAVSISYPYTSNCGDGTGGLTSQKYTANGNGGGGAYESSILPAQGGSFASGGGGGNATVGGGGDSWHNSGQATLEGQNIPGYGGSIAGNNNLTTLVMGGGGGGGVKDTQPFTAGGGGAGGGIIFIVANNIAIITGSILANGGTGGGINDGDPDAGYGCVGGGGGAGGSVLIKTTTASLGTNKIVANGGGSHGTYRNFGGNGGIGRIHIDYFTSYTGTTTPTIDVSQDNNLSGNTTYQLRLSISSNGTNSETMARNCSLTVGAWKHVAVVWTAASHLSEFFLNANSLGTSTGALTAIHDNASSFLLASQDTDLGSYYDGKMDEARVWSTARTQSQILSNKDIQISGSTANLNAYYQLNNLWTDSTAGNNTLTAVNAPAFTTDTPFLMPSTRLDIDLSQTATGQTYTIPTTISETVANEVFIIPTKDPLKSISVLVAAKGTGNWTLTLHDFNNTVVSSTTITNANIIAGVQNEFIFSSPVRFQIGGTYHFHLTSTVADGTVTTNTVSNLSTVDYKTYFGYLVTDTNFHPAIPFLNFEVIGNERYLATWDGVFYNPNLITFPPQTSVRCFALWRNYLAIGTWRQKNSGTSNIYDWDQGRVYFWDGISLTFNFWIDVSEGQINAMVGDNTTLYMFAGFRGDLLSYEGGYVTSVGSNMTAKIRKIPLLARNDYTEIYPGAINKWRSMIHFGATANTSSTTVAKGVYSWGTINKLYTPSLSLDYPISTGSTGSTVKIGLVYPVGQTLLIGWQDGASYGCDQVNFNNRSASYGTVQTLLMDGGQVWKQNSVMKVRADHTVLRTGETVAVKYKLDRESSWETAGALTDTSGQFSTINVANGRGKEYQFAVDMYSTNGTSPTLLELSGEIEDNASELQF